MQSNLGLDKKKKKTLSCSLCLLIKDLTTLTLKSKGLAQYSCLANCCPLTQMWLCFSDGQNDLYLYIVLNVLK